MMKRFLGVLACAVITSTALAGEEPKPEASKVRSELDEMQGKPAPNLQLDNWMNARPMQLADLKGKIVVLDFWATWCGPCIASIPKANEISKKYADKGVVFVGVCAQRGAEKMKETADKHKIEYPIAADSAGKTVAAYKANSYPDYYIIDRKGVLRWADFANAEVEKAIEILLAEK